MKLSYIIVFLTLNLLAFNVHSMNTAHNDEEDNTQSEQPMRCHYSEPLLPANADHILNTELSRLEKWLKSMSPDRSEFNAAYALLEKTRKEQKTR